MAALRDEEVRERREARLVDGGRGALRVVEEMLALGEAAQLVGASRGDDRGDAPGLLAHERLRGALLRRGVAALEEGEERVVEGLAVARALALLAVRPHAPGDGHERRDHPREEVEGEVARRHEEDEEVHRELDPPRRGDDHHVAGRALREERDAHRERGEDEGPDGEAHG